MVTILIIICCVIGYLLIGTFLAALEFKYKITDAFSDGSSESFSAITLFWPLVILGCCIGYGLKPFYSLYKVLIKKYHNPKSTN